MSTYVCVDPGTVVVTSMMVGTTVVTTDSVVYTTVMTLPDLVSVSVVGQTVVYVDVTSLVTLASCQLVALHCNRWSGGLRYRSRKCDGKVLTISLL